MIFFLAPLQKECLKLTFLEVTFTILHLLGIYNFLVVHLHKVTPEFTEPISIGDKLMKPVQSFVEIE